MHSSAYFKCLLNSPSKGHYHCQEVHMVIVYNIRTHWPKRFPDTDSTVYLGRIVFYFIIKNKHPTSKTNEMLIASYRHNHLKTEHPLAPAETCLWSCMACPHRHMVACWADTVLSLACCVSHRQPCCACRTKLGQHQDHKSVLEPPDNASFGAVTGSPSLDFLCDDNSIFILFDLILNLMFFLWNT